MKTARQLCLCGCLLLGTTALSGPGASLAQEGPIMLFAVVTAVPEDRREVTAQVFVNGEVSEAILIATDVTLANMMWKKLEICQSMRAQAWKTEKGYRIESFRILGASMLPMTLQGVAGDCLIRKALEYAPLLD